MPFRLSAVKLDKSAGPIHRALQYAFYDWASEMPRSKHIMTYVGFALQGYAFYFTLVWASMLPKWRGAHDGKSQITRRPEIQRG
jgi:hypothetical protein